MESISLVDCLLHFRFAARNHWGCSSFIGYIVVVRAPTGHGGCGEFSLCSFLLKNCCWQLVLLVTELSSSSCLLPTFRRAHILYMEKILWLCCCYKVNLLAALAVVSASHQPDGPGLSLLPLPLSLFLVCLRIGPVSH